MSHDVPPSLKAILLQLYFNNESGCHFTTAMFHNLVDWKDAEGCRNCQVALQKQALAAWHSWKTSKLYWGEGSSLHGMYLEDVDDRKIELDTPCH